MTPLISMGTLIPLRIWSIRSQLAAGRDIAANFAGPELGSALRNGAPVVIQMALQPDLTARFIFARTAERSPSGKTWYQRIVDDSAAIFSKGMLASLLTTIHALAAEA